MYLVMIAAAQWLFYVDKTTPTTLIRTRMHIDEFVCRMWRSAIAGGRFLYRVLNHRDEIKCARALLFTPYYNSQYREFPHQRHGIKCAPS